MFGLSVDTLRNIREAFARLPSIEKVLLYGSRAKGNYQTGSDIDITLIGKNLTLDNTIYPLQDALDKLYLPHTFDISIFNQLDEPAFIDHILRVGKTFYERKSGVMGEWTASTLGKLCHIELGRTPPRDNLNFWDTGKVTDNVWVSIADLPQTFNARVSESKEHISDEALAKCKIVVEGTLLVSFKLTLGRLAFAGRNLYTNEAIASLTILDEKEIMKEYLYWYLTYFDWDKAAEGEEKIKGKTLNKKKLNVLPVIIPPLPKQEQIVATLDEAFAAIATATTNTKTNLANARELFESQLEKVFTGDAVMDGWEAVPLSQCLQRIDTPKKIPRKQYENSGRFPIVSQERDLINGYWSDENDVIYVNSPLVVFGDHTQTLKYIDFDFVVGADGVKLLQPKAFLNPKYFYYFLIGHPVDSLGYARHFRLIKEHKVVFPKSLSEQKRIVATLDKLSADTQSLSDTYNTKLNALAELKQSLLHQAFSGALTADANAADRSLSETGA